MVVEIYTLGCLISQEGKIKRYLTINKLHYEE